jgi:hypothetical protein
MINLTHIISILNSIFTVVVYVTRWTKLDIDCICFEEFINQLNFLYICLYLYLQQNKSYETHELDHGPKIFITLSLVQWPENEHYISFYIFNFGVFLWTFNLYLFWAKKDPSSFDNFKFCHTILQHRTGLSTNCLI